MIRTTQVSSLKKLKNLDGKRKTVYDIIKIKGKATNRMIAKALAWDINRVTGRVTELVGQVQWTQTELTMIKKLIELLHYGKRCDSKD